MAKSADKIVTVISNLVRLDGWLKFKFNDTCNKWGHNVP